MPGREHVNRASDLIEIEKTWLQKTKSLGNTIFWRPESFMAEPVTIDNFDVRFHERYAIDQGLIDRTFVDDSLIPPHLSIAGSQSSFASKLEELFETDEAVHPFANFCMPPGFATARNRFFSFAISIQFEWQSQQAKAQEYREAVLTQRPQGLPPALLERDRSALLNLIDSVERLNGFLQRIHGKKLEYQKG